MFIHVLPDGKTSQQTSLWKTSSQTSNSSTLTKAFFHEYVLALSGPIYLVMLPPSFLHPQIFSAKVNVSPKTSNNGKEVKTWKLFFGMCSHSCEASINKNSFILRNSQQQSSPYTHGETLNFSIWSVILSGWRRKMREKWNAEQWQLKYIRKTEGDTWR